MTEVWTDPWLPPVGAVGRKQWVRTMLPEGIVSCYFEIEYFEAGSQSIASLEIEYEDGASFRDHWWEDEPLEWAVVAEAKTRCEHYMRYPPHKEPSREDMTVRVDITADNQGRYSVADIMRASEWLQHKVRQGAAGMGSSDMQEREVQSILHRVAKALRAAADLAAKGEIG